jgi:AraC family transcriptional regulator
LLTAAEVSAVVVPGSSLLTSEAHSWADVEVVQRRHPTDDLEVPALASHLLIIYQGRATIEMVARIGGEQFTRQLRPGALAVVPAAHASDWHWRGEPPRLHDALHIYLHPSRLMITPKDRGVSGVLESAFGIYDTQIAALGRSFLEELTQRNVGEQLYVDALTTMLAVHLVRHYVVHTQAPAPAPRGRLSAEELDRLTDYIEAMLQRPLRLAELASIVHLSPYHFARIFKLSTGQSVHQYVVARRVERARQLLLGDLPIAEIAALVGFTDQSHLTAHVRRRFGLTPRQLRDRARSS